MQKSLTMFCVLAALGVASVNHVQAQQAPGRAASPATGVVRLLPDMREHGLLLRSGAGYGSSISANIAEGTPVLVTQRKGGWSAIAYAPGTAAGDLARVCGVSGPLPGGAAYTGPCRMGWAENRFIQPR